MSRYDNYGQKDTQFVSSGDTSFQRMNSRLRPDQLQPGELAYSQNGRMDVDGAWQPRKGYNFFGGSISTSSESLILPFTLYASKSISSATRSTVTVTVTTTTNHGFTTGTQVGIAGLTGTVDPNGNRTITVTGLTTFTFTITGATGSETYGGTGTAGTAYLSGNNNAAYGSCLFSDPSNSNAEYTIIALNDKAVAINMVSKASTDIAYPSGTAIQSSVELLQAFGKVLIFRNGATALEWNGSFSGTPAFTKVSNGTYTYPTYYDAASNTVITDGVVTVTQTAHGLSVGDQIYVVDKGSSTLTVDQGGYTVASVPTADTFTFYAQVPDMASHSVVFSKRGSEGRGFSRMPAPPWGIYHQRRLIVPYFYTTTGTPGSETITSRNIRDELIISDILDYNTYDQLQNQFKITAGVADYLQTVHPFTDDNAVAFNRNSMHLISGLSGSLSDISVKEITRETGLVARKSVVTIGNAIYFLSDNGVYAVEFGDLYNLRGAGVPLSDPINPIVKRINSAYAQNAVGIFFDNRYYLAVPLDDSTVNNAILVYNLLNGGWESVDLVNSQLWDISNLISSGAGTVQKLYAVNRYGGIHQLEAREDDFDYLALGAGISPSGYAVDSYVTSRQYTMGMADRKKFNSFELHMESTATNASNALIEIETENTDSLASLGTLSDYLTASGVTAPLEASEDASVRGRIGNIRGYGLQVSVSPSQGRPKLRMIRINAIPAFNSLTAAI